MKSILLIGGTGVLSSAVAAEALRCGIATTIMTRGSRQPPPGVESLVCDCRDLEKVEAVLKGRRFTAVIDFLSFVPEQLEASFKAYSRHAEQYVFVSSYAVYDTKKAGENLDEMSPKCPADWVYGANKWRCEERLREMSKCGDCRYTVVRPAITYGDTRIPYGVAPGYGWHWTIAARVLAGKPVVTWNSGGNFVNMMRVEDFAVGVVGLVGNPKAMDEAYNICGDEVPTYGDVLKALGAALGRDAITVDVPPEIYARSLGPMADTFLGGRCLDARISNAKIKEAVPEFRQRIGLRDGVARTVRAYVAQGYQHGIDWRFDGMTDRVVSNAGAHAPFVDYLGNASWSDRKRYFREKCRHHPFVRILSLLGSYMAKGGSSRAK